MLLTLKKILRASIFIGDTAQQQVFFHEVHLLSTTAYIFALVCWSLAALLMPNHTNFDTTTALFNFLGMAGGVALTCFSRTLKSTLLCGAVSIVFISFGFRSLNACVPDPSFWVLPVGLLITLTSATIFCGIGNYLGLVCCVWLILGVGHFPFYPGRDDQYWPALVVGASVMIGVALNVSFLTLRVKNYHSHAVLENLAFIDALTGLKNRRRFNQCARTLHQNRANASYFFLMLDIDDFKKINDRFGHDQGDEVLQRTAAIIAELSASNPCGRLGGEEFAIIYEGDDTGVRAFATLLLRAVASADVVVAGVSVSLGIAAFDGSASLEDCYKRADESLYLAKMNGKNRFHYAAGPSSG